MICMGAMGIVLAASILAGAAVLFTVGRAAVSALEHIHAHLESIHKLMGTGLVTLSEPTEKRVRDLEDLVDRLPQRWDALKEEADAIFRRARAAEERGRAAVGRARQELQDRGLADDGIEAAWEDLRGDDDGGGAEEGVLPMHPGVAPDPEPIPIEELSAADQVEHVRRLLRGAR